MRISTFAYCVKQGIVNICRNILFSLASMATISACIFLFCLFFAIAANVRNAALTAQNTLGITVFFAVILVICILVVDILYVLIDPRIKYQ